jgi:cell division protein FtsQ
VKTHINRIGNRDLRLQDRYHLLRDWLNWFFKGVKILPIVIIGIAMIWSAKYLFVKFDIPINNISVFGTFSNIEKKEVKELIITTVSDSKILSSDLMKITSLLESHPWIERAFVRRKWPSGIEVKVIEEVPLARWGDRNFLNDRGEILDLNNRNLSSLPVLTGVENSERLIMNTYQEISLLLRPAGLKIIELSYNNQGIWKLTLSNGLEILIGRDQIIEKIRRFLIIWMATLKSSSTDMDGVDIRYDNGIAVRWK